MPDNLWGVGFFNKESKDSFIALFLEHKAEEVAGTETFRRADDCPIGGTDNCDRYPLPGKHLPGAVLHERTPTSSCRSRRRTDRA